MKISSLLLLLLLLTACYATVSPHSSTTPPPETTVEPKIALYDSITEVLGTVDGTNSRLTSITYSFPEKGDITIAWAIHHYENEEALILEGALRDATAILNVLEEQQTLFLYVILSGKLILADGTGTLPTNEIVRIEFNHSTLNKIDPDDLLPANVCELADLCSLDH